MNVTKKISFKLILICLVIFLSKNSKANSLDSVWCHNLLEIIKCASTDEIALPVGNFEHYTDVKAFKPHVVLFPNKKEIIEKINGKVAYEALVYTSEINNEAFQKKYQSLLTKTKACLYDWELDSLAQKAPMPTDVMQYFFFNYEDETAIRLDIVKINKLYAVRFRVL